MDNEGKIRDIPSIKKLLDDSRNISRFRRAMPFLGPVLRLLGADVDGINRALADVSELAREADEIARVPDDFNDLFVDRGWIMYDRMDLQVAKAAVEKAKGGDIEGAEDDLVRYFDSEAVRWGLMSMNGVHAFRARMPLAEKALVDYREGRYHACVPVVLALLDGMVNEVHQKARGTRRGISAEGVDLSAWDSFAAHKNGLNRLLKVVQAGRRRTTTDEISLPFRHGIIHGIDLGYDNVMVAAKTWALLFAAREWAIKAERGELHEPPLEPAPTVRDTWAQWMETAQQVKALQIAKKRMADWKPRLLRVGRDLPRTGRPEAFPPATPERALVEYLHSWQASNYGFMARQTSLSSLRGVKNAPAMLREEFRAKRLVSFTIRSVLDEAPALTVIPTELVMEVAGEVCVAEKEFRMIYAGSDGLPAVIEAGEWKVLTWAL